MIPLLQQVVILAGVGVLVATLLERLRLPIAAGLILAGAVVGPHALGLVHDVHVVENLAEIGVVLLLFTIGLEFSWGRIAAMGRLVAVGGALQVGLTIGAVALLAVATGDRPSHGLFLGFVIALSSTAIVLRALVERDEVDAPHGRFVVAVLLFQDLCVVPLMLLLPVLAGQTGGLHPGLAVAAALGKAAVVVLATVLVSRLVVPRVLQHVDRARSREIFLLAVLVICAGTAWATSTAGMSLALGAFVAGMVLADSPYAHRALAEVLPLRDLFASVFFLSVGMLFDPRALATSPRLVALLFVGILVGKGLLATVAVLALRFPLRVALLTGAGLAQFGEFGFVLAAEGQRLGLIAEAEWNVLLAAGVLTMFVTPLVMRASPHLVQRVGRLRALERLRLSRGAEPEHPDERLAGHVVVVGLGVAGRLVCRALKASGLSYVVIELSADSVSAARAEGEPAFYGDVTSAETLLHAGVHRARALVLVISDPAATALAVAASRRHAPETPVYVRTRYLATTASLRELGATEVVAAEVEAGVEVLARVLRDAGLPRNVIDDRLRESRESTAESARRVTIPRRRLGELAELDDLKVESYEVRGADHAVGKSVVDLHLRTRTSALLVAIRRGGALLEYPDAHAPLLAGDVLYLVGSGPALSAACHVLAEGERREEPRPA